MRIRLRLARGFTLIELLMTLAIAAVLMAVVGPSLVQFKRNSELTSFTNDLLAAINAARSEALRRNMAAYVVPTNNGSSWNAGWVVFVDTDRSQDYNAANDLTIQVQSAVPSYFNITGNNSAGETPAYIRFDSSGYAKKKNAAQGSLTLNIARTDTSSTAESRQIRIAVTGRTRSCNPATDTSCVSSTTD